MVFRKENKVAAFERQLSAIRQQLGGTGAELDEVEGVYEQADEDADERIEPRSGGYGNESPRDSERESGFGRPTAADPGHGTAQMEDEAMEISVPEVDEQTSVIANGTTWNGDLNSQGNIHIHGRLEGSLTVKLDVFVADDADVDANITATNVVVAGLTKGTIRCSSKFEVLPTGRVYGDVQAPTLVIHEGATVSGQLRMSAVESPAEPRTGAVIQRRASRGSA